MSTTVAKYTSYQAKRYVTEYFPASVIWQYFAPPPSPTLEDTADGGDSNDNDDYYNNRELKAEEFLLNLAQSADNGKYLREELRDWRFNKSYGNFTCDSAARFNELYLTKATGKYDAGAIRLLPLESLSSNPAISKQFVVDFDATDYRQLRTMCGCGVGTENKTKMCAKCSRVMGVAAKVTVDILEKAYSFKRVHCFFSGGRGIHVRVLDVRASCLSDTAREFIANTIIRAPQLGNEVAKLCQPFIDLGKEMNLRFDSIIIDEGVSTAITKLTRGPFSIHDKTGYLCVPLANPLDFDIPTIGIHVTDLVNPASPNHAESKRRFQSALRLLQEWATVE
jgi:hypothetical protein